MRIVSLILNYSIKNIRNFILIFSIFFLSFNLNAESVNSLMKDFCDSKNEERLAYCDGYIVGVLETYRNLIEMEVFNKMYCLPPNIMSRDLISSFRKYIKKHPENNNTVASSVLLGFMMEKYPCS